MDRLTPARRSRLMSAVRGKNTTPELIVRRMVHAMGLRFRLYRDDLPGTPDLVLARHRTVILVNGCFWHAHTCRHGRREPKSNVLFWRKKRVRNRQRDRKVRAALRALGWSVLVVWQCEIKQPDRLRARLSVALASKPGRNRRRDR